MADKEQRICIKFCFNLEKTAAETHQMLKEVFGADATSQSQTFLWYKRFKDGRTAVDDDEHSERPSAAKKIRKKNTAKLRKKTLTADSSQQIEKK